MSKAAAGGARLRAHLAWASAVVAVSAILWLGGLALAAVDRAPEWSPEDAALIAAGAGWTAALSALGCVLLAGVLVGGARDRLDQREAIVIGAAMAVVVLPDALLALVTVRDSLPGGMSESRALALWTVSRTALAAALVVGPLCALSARRARTLAWPIATVGAIAWMITLAVVLGPAPPTLHAPGAVVPRPWDLPALVVFAVGGLAILPFAVRRRPTPLGRALLLSAVPQTLAQIEAAFGGSPHADGHPLVAQLLRLLAYTGLAGALALELLHKSRMVSTTTLELETSQHELTRQTEALERADRERIVEEAKRRRAERLLQMLEKAVERMSIGVVITEPDTTILYVNPAAASMHGYRPRELMGTHIDLLAPDGMPAPPIDDSATGGRPWVREQTSRTKEGDTFPCRLVSDRVRDDRGKVVALVTCCEDISERRRVEQMKQDFVATISHELRTPLTSIVAALGLLGQPGLRAEPDRIEELISVAHRNSQRLLSLVNDLLDLQRLSAGRLKLEAKPIDVPALLEEAAAGMRAFAQEKGVQIEVQADAALRVVGDRRRLVQVLLNLLSNAIKYSPAGTAVRLSGTLENGTSVLAVRDRGPGIPEAFRDQLFERFSQADASTARATGGSGLGLAIARQLVEAMGGSIGFETAEGEGTTFHVALPPNGAA